MKTIWELMNMPTFLLKILELLVACISIGLVEGEWFVGVSPSKVALVNGTLIGYIMFSIVIILGVVLEVPLERTLILVITLPGAILFFTSGALIIEAWDTYSLPAGKVLGAGIVALLNGFAYLVDFALTFFKYR